MYFKNVSYSTEYPPINTNFVNGVVADQPASMQIESSIVYSVNDATVESDFRVFGFKSVARSPLNVLLNGVDTGQTIKAGSGSTKYEIDALTTIYGYTVTPTSINLWTDPAYIDSSQPMMYGRRGLYVHPYEDAVYDWKSWSEPTHQNYAEYAILHNYYSYGLLLQKKVTTTDGAKVYLYIENGVDPSASGIIRPQFLLNSQVISTGTVEQEINLLKNELVQIEDQVRAIKTTVESLVPDLTKLISAEASKNYVAR